MNNTYEIIETVNEDNFPNKIVTSVMVILISKDTKYRRKRLFIGDNGYVFSGEGLSTYLGLSDRGIIRRWQMYGIDHEYFLMRIIPHSARNLGNKKRSIAIDKRRGKKADIETKVGKFDYLLENDVMHVRTSKPINPPTPMNVHKTKEILERFNSKMARSGFIAPKGDYNSFSRYMLA